MGPTPAKEIIPHTIMLPISKFHSFLNALRR